MSCNCNNAGCDPHAGPPKAIKKVDPFVSLEVKQYVHGNFSLEQTPAQMIMRQYAANIQNLAIGRALLDEMRALRTAFCRHAGGYCGVGGCVPPNQGPTDGADA